MYRPVTPAAFALATAPLWRTLDALHPQLWRAGRQFPLNAEAMRQMLADGELLLALTFNPNDAANEIAAKRLPASIVSYQFESGTIGNTHFVAIPFNASASGGNRGGGGSCRRRAPPGLPPSSSAAAVLSPPGRVATPSTGSDEACEARVAGGGARRGRARSEKEAELWGRGRRKRSERRQ